MKFDMKLPDNGKLRNAIKKVSKKYEVDVKAIITEGTLAIHETAVKSLAKQSSGKKEVRYDHKRTVIVSKPGDPPNSDKGQAIQSIQFEFEDGGKIGKVGTNLNYLAALEFDASNGRKARPWLGPAYLKHRDNIIKNFKKRKGA